MNVEAFWQPYSGAVSLTFDDGQNRRSQLGYAIPAMEKRGMRAEKRTNSGRTCYCGIGGIS